MTDTQQNLLQKKQDLKIYYQLAEEAAQASDLEQALRLSQNGLKFAKAQKKADWVEKFDNLNLQLSQVSSDHNLITSSSAKEDFRIIKGVGPAVAKKLREGNIDSIIKLAKISPEILASSIAGIGLATAHKIIDGAKEHLSLKKLNHFSYSVKEIKEEKNQKILDVNLNDKESFLKKEENTEDIKNNTESINKLPWSDNKYNYSRLGRSYEIGRKIINLDEFEDVDDTEGDDININEQNIKIQEESVFRDNKEIPHIQEFIDSNESIEIKSSVIPYQVQESLSSKASSTFQDIHGKNMEALSFKDSNKLIDKIYDDFRSCNFDIISKHPDLKEIYDGIDMVAIKLINVFEYLDLLLLIPIKISHLKGSFIVSEDNIIYKPKEYKENNIQNNRTPLSYIKVLNKVREAIHCDIVNQGKFSKRLNNQLSPNIYVKKTITHKALFFHSGERQYKLFVDPVIVCQNTVGFIEKVLPFAYQKQNNTHIVSKSQLNSFLDYIVQKYILSEENSEQDPAYKTYFIAKDRFCLNLRNIGFPFLLYSLAFIFIFIFQEYSALPLLINLGFGLIGLLTIIIGYVYLKFYKIKVNLNNNFKIPYYQQLRSFNKTSLTLIKNKLTPKFMEQFIYEWLGKNINSNVLEKIELGNAKEYLSEKILNKRVKKAELFEIQNQNHNNAENLERKNQYIQKYSSFLED